MNYTISPDRRTLTVTVDEQERNDLRELGEVIHQDATMHELFESLVCNPGIDWVNPADTGDLTSAPMLGIKSLPEPSVREDFRTGQYVPTLNGMDISPTSFDKTRAMDIAIQASDDSGPNIIERWWFPQYQIRSVLEDLRDTGVAIFTC